MPNANLEKENNNIDFEIYNLMHKLLDVDTPNDAIKKWKNLKDILRVTKREIEEEDLKIKDFLTTYLQERN